MPQILPEELSNKLNLNRLIGIIRDATNDEIASNLPKSLEQTLANPTGTYQAINREHKQNLLVTYKTVDGISNDMQEVLFILRSLYQNMIDETFNKMPMGRKKKRKPDKTGKIPKKEKKKKDKPKKGPKGIGLGGALSVGVGALLLSQLISPNNLPNIGGLLGGVDFGSLGLGAAGLGAAALAMRGRSGGADSPKSGKFDKLKGAGRTAIKGGKIAIGAYLLDAVINKRLYTPDLTDIGGMVAGSMAGSAIGNKVFGNKSVPTTSVPSVPGPAAPVDTKPKPVGYKFFPAAEPAPPKPSKMSQFFNKARDIGGSVVSKASTAFKFGIAPVLVGAALYQKWPEITKIRDGNEKYEVKIKKMGAIFDELIKEFGIAAVSTAVGTLAGSAVPGVGNLTGLIAGLGTGIGASYLLSDVDLGVGEKIASLLISNPEEEKKKEEKRAEQKKVSEEIPKGWGSRAEHIGRENNEQQKQRLEREKKAFQTAIPKTETKATDQPTKATETTGSGILDMIKGPLESLGIPKDAIEGLKTALPSLSGITGTYNSIVDAAKENVDPKILKSLTSSMQIPSPSTSAAAQAVVPAQRVESTVPGVSGQLNKENMMQKAQVFHIPTSFAIAALRNNGLADVYSHPYAGSTMERSEKGGENLFI